MATRSWLDVQLRRLHSKLHGNRLTIQMLKWNVWTHEHTPHTHTHTHTHAHTTRTYTIHTKQHTYTLYTNCHSHPHTNSHARTHIHTLYTHPYTLTLTRIPIHTHTHTQYCKFRNQTFSFLKKEIKWKKSSACFSTIHLYLLCTYCSVTV
jgi:hypothetical protein